MKSKIFVLIGWLMLIQGHFLKIYAQQGNEPPFGHVVQGDNVGFLDDQLWFGQKQIQQYKDKRFAKKTLFLAIKLNPNLKYFFGSRVYSNTKQFQSYIIADSTDAELMALGITQENVNDYRYHVVENDSVEVVPWTKPQLQKKYNAKYPYGFMGKFNRPGKQLLIEVVNIHDYNIRDGVIFDWRVNFKPQVAGMFIGIKSTGEHIDVTNLQAAKEYVKKLDIKTGIPLDLKFFADSLYNLDVNFMHHETYAYTAYLVKETSGQKDTTLIQDRILDNYISVTPEMFKTPGRYQIIIWSVGKRGGDSQSVKIPFEVMAPPDKKASISLKQALPYIIATLTGVVLLFGGYYRRNQVRLLRAAQQKQTAGLKLQSIRAQLNPHFMFNALTSIQNLVNKNDMAAANHYLAKFAGLTRQVLDSGNDELLSLEQEINILTDYLQMEQLRFGFEYHIDVDSTLNQANTEIPAMLLQPFVENAVKHGVAILKEAGRIDISINRVNKDLVFCIKDNGKWIDTDADGNKSGYGLKLSEERVALLNQLYKDQPVYLTIDKQPATVVCIRLTNWI
jgi:two-component system LytT family sensor kinase